MVELGFHTRLDYGSRPAWTSGLERGTAHAGLKNLGNSCWLNAVLQCFRWTRSLHNAFTARLMDCEESILGSLVQDVLQKLASDDWDYVAPFALLNQLYATYQGRFRPGESADAAEACRLLLDRCVYGSDIVHLLPTSIALARRGVTLTELTREHFTTCRPSSDVVILEVPPVDGGRMNWSQLLVTPPAGEGNNYLYTVSGFVAHETVAPGPDAPGVRAAGAPPGTAAAMAVGSHLGRFAAALQRKRREASRARAGQLGWERSIANCIQSTQTANLPTMGFIDLIIR
ncbi:unnamed protein product [Cladocopium goreaui]|uniref:ubiquitinyl hydrolase 1 n=1 Tax=Cladocopium goreaui TaxID=2562237 RepID=A0A9P1DJ17_9DINO|nr:unnamed protein product [Cladocopium goreaui]